MTVFKRVVNFHQPSFVLW